MLYSKFPPTSLSETAAILGVAAASSISVAKKAASEPRRPGPWLAAWTATSIVSAHAATGESQFQAPARRAGCRDGFCAGPKRRRAISGEGRRGVQDCNRFSNGFISSILGSFQVQSQFVQAVTVSAGGGVRRNVKQISNRLKRQPMPNLQDDHLALRGGQLGQPAHGLGFGLVVVRAALEPADRLPFAGQPAPEAAMMVERAVAEGAQAVMLGVVGRLRQLQQRQKRLLQNVFRFAVVQAQGATVKDQPRRFGFVKRLAPATVALRCVHAMAQFNVNCLSLQSIDTKRGDFV